MLTFKPPFGAYPVELGQVYPFNAEVVATPDHEALERALENTIRLIELNQDAEFTFIRKDGLEHQLFDKLAINANVIGGDK